MADPITAAGLAHGAGFALAGKKTLLGILGMATATSEDVVKLWPVLAVLIVPLATGAFFMGQISEKLGNISQSFAGELALRDLKIDFAYDRANLGDRFTEDDGESLRTDFNKRCLAMRERVTKLEHQCKDNSERLDTAESMFHIGKHRENGIGYTQ